MCFLRVALIGLSLLWSTIAGAHIVREAPWHPLAHGYRQAVFLLNLEPVPWSTVKSAFRQPGREAAFDQSAYAVLKELDQAQGSDHVARLRQAVAAQDAGAVYAVATRAVAAGILHHLQRAAAQLEQPGKAATALRRAQALYRAFADFIPETQPELARSLGRAWLQLNTAVGTQGVAGAGAHPPDRSKFTRAQEKIADFVRTAFQPEHFQSRRRYFPVAEPYFREHPEVEVAPWLPPGTKISEPRPLPRLVLNLEAKGVSEDRVTMVAYGDMLFDSPQLFGEPARSLGLTCSSCHPRSDRNKAFFIPGISHQPGAVDVDSHYFNSLFNDRTADSLDIPSLRGIRFTAPYGRDGRFASLRAFIRNVIVNEFGGPEPTEFMLDSLVQYLFEFDFLPTPHLRTDGTLKESAPAAARRGAELFRQPFAQMDGRSCASCHQPDSHFTDGKRHNIGSMETSSQDSRAGALETPTLLGVAHTAPYFHDGRLASLAEVVAWFDQHYQLGLSALDRHDLTAYLKAVGTGHQPYHQFQGKQTAFRLSFQELSTFLATLDALLPRRDRFHITLLLETVTADLVADASTMQNKPARAKVDELVNQLRELRAAVKQEHWSRAKQLWTVYKRKQRAYSSAMY